MTTAVNKITNCSGAIHVGDYLYVITTHHTDAETLPGRALNIQHTESNALLFSTEITYTS